MNLETLKKLVNTDYTPVKYSEDAVCRVQMKSNKLYGPIYIVWENGKIIIKHMDTAESTNVVGHKLSELGYKGISLKKDVMNDSRFPTHVVSVMYKNVVRANLEEFLSILWFLIEIYGTKEGTADILAKFNIWNTEKGEQNGVEINWDTKDIPIRDFLESIANGIERLTE